MELTPFDAGPITSQEEPMFNVSLNLARDWENLTADSALTDIFDTITLDTYARTSETGEKCWLIRGTTPNVAEFTINLTNHVDQHHIISLGFERAN
jgi:hypothetical protein